MPDISVDLDVLRHAVLDAPLTRVDTLLKTDVKAPVKIGPIGLTPSAGLTVRVLNRPEEKDDDAIVGGGPAAHIAFDMNNAWVKYKLTAQADAKVGFGELGAKGAAEIDLSDYRIHTATAGAWEAMRGDLASPRTLLDLGDVRDLRPGEALAMELGGAVSASVSLSWSDVISSRLADILAEFPQRVPVTVKIPSGAEVKASVKLTDHFSVVISRTRDGHYRFAVNKAKSRTHTFGIEVSLGIEISAAPALRQVLAPLFEAVTGVAVDQAEALARKIGLAPLTTEEDDVVQKIAQRLGLGNATGREAAVKTAIEDVENKLLRKLEAAVKWKAETGVAYEYARIDENTAIADFILLDESRLKDDYQLVIDGDFAAIAETLRTDTQAHSLVRYLNETTLTRRSSFGFSLGIGKWLQVAAKDQSVFAQTTRTSLDGFRLITSRGTRRYDEKNIPENDFEWIVDLKAQMTEFLERPSSSDFDYGLHYAVILERGALAKDDLRRMLDFAAMWDVCLPDESEFADAIGRKATVRVQFILDREALAATLAAPSADEAWIAPLAMAMPYSSNFPERRAFGARRDVYSDAWRAWLAGENRSNAGWLSLVKPHIASGLVLLEERALPGSFAWTCDDGHAHLRDHLGAFTRGARALHLAMTTAQRPEAIGDAYNALQRFWSSRLYIAASGRWLLDRARDAGAQVTTTMQIDFDEESVVV